MTDQIPADKVRKIIAAHRDGASGKGGLILAALKDLLPPPPRPTLADMTMPERLARKWMQADVEGGEDGAVIVNPYWKEGSARLMWPGGLMEEIGWEKVTPRPDLPSLEWPGTEKPAPAPALPEEWRLADHKDNGRVIVTTPNDDGRVYYVLPSDFDGLGFDWFFCHTDELTYLDGDQ